MQARSLFQEAEGSRTVDWREVHKLLRQLRSPSFLSTLQDYHGFQKLCSLKKNNLSSGTKSLFKTRTMPEIIRS